MQALSKMVYVVTTEVEPEWEDEFNRWYDEEHVPALMSVPGYLSGSRYMAVEGAPKYMAFWEIESLEAYRNPEHDRAANTPWSERLRPHRKAQLAFFRQVFPPDGLLRGAAWGDGNVQPGALLTVRLDVAPEHEQDLRDWYDREHLAALAGVPGTIATRRLEAIEGGPKFLAVYYLTSPEVQASEAWKRAIDTPWSARARETFRTRWRVVYRPLDGR
jgi:antibiotic biosynthesis monooxygenase (ABM) superfamily enzyme